ncbi:MAG: hypothetical protein Ct9H90mP20_2590 [Candidatus Neomarinimicrobiota bacterium]|nr:MAG: hypothetical protein Ct9H90mP20_2590 [Candidatus Neomarinimicrobiota bacterium]
MVSVQILGSILLMTPDMGMFVSGSSFGIVFGGMLASVAGFLSNERCIAAWGSYGGCFQRWRDTLGGLVDEAVEAAEAGRKGTADLEKNIDRLEAFSLRMGSNGH